MKNQKIVIGISGVAQSGKDTFFQLSSRYLYEEHGLSCKRYALADFLKDECKDFLRDKFDINVYSQKIEDKNVFRPFLVWFGDIKRSQTQGTYFTKILERQILSDDIDVAFITDIRYGEYPKDEAQWLKHKLRGKLIHLQRTDVYGNLVLPPNKNEARNDPIMQREADIRFLWETHFNPEEDRFLDKMYDFWNPHIEHIYLNKLNVVKHDVAIEQAMDVAEFLMKE